MPAVPVELRAHTAFSFGDGAMSPEMLATRAKELGYDAIGITDNADLGGIVRLGVTCAKAGIRAVVGAEFVVDGHPLALLARTDVGYHHLAALVTRSRVGNLRHWRQGEGPSRGTPRLTWADVERRSKDLHLLTGPPSGALATLLRAGQRDEAAHLLDQWRHVFGSHLAVEVQLHHAGRDEAALAGALVELAERTGVPWVVAQDARYLDDGGRLVHDILTTLRHDTDIVTAEARGWLHPNGEWRLLDPATLAARWKGREAGLEASTQIASECSFKLDWVRPPLPTFDVPDGMTDDSYLREKVYEGAAKRWPNMGDRERTQIEHELDIIRKLGFAGFFLVMWDGVRQAHELGILCQGRGSAANSAVAYCLEITAVDPVEHGLLFERFLSQARVGEQTEAPDIDVDVEHERREEVLNYMYGHYHRHKSGLTCVTQLYSACTALQDTMRAFGYPAELAFAISKRLHRYDCEGGAEKLAAGLASEHGLDLVEPRGQALLAAMRAFQDLPRLRSTHPGGFVLSSESLGDYMPIEETTMGRTIIQFDKDDLDHVGVPKFDFLGLGALSLVRRAFDAIEASGRPRPSIYALPQNDAATYDLIARGETVGMFQIESRAQIASIVHTRPERLYDIVVQVALVRPGPIQARFVRPYTRRRRGLEPVTYLHPKLEPILKRTQGIPIFQEQAMTIAMELAGYSATEADELRRTMGHQRKAQRLTEALKMLRQRMEDHGVAVGVAAQMQEDLQSFANYGFPESHAWSFALIAYATAYLKAHHPTEFLFGLLNSWPMGFYPPSTLIHDARRMGATVLGPCLRDGDRDCTVEPHAEAAGGTALRIGWRFIRGLGDQGLAALEATRHAAPFRDIEDIVRRARLTRSDAVAIARAGAFAAWEPDRRRAAWIALGVVGDTLPLAPARRAPYVPKPMTPREIVFLDYFATGASVYGHPMQFLRDRVRAGGAHDSRSIRELRGGERIVVAGLVVVRQRPGSANGTIFILLEDEHGFINVIIAPDLVEPNYHAIHSSTFLLVEGQFERDGDERNVVAAKLRTLRVGGLAHQSHDFH